MTRIKFEKYQGCGNDFVIVDNRNNNIQLSKNQIFRLCDRRFGIGADGFIEIIKNDNNHFLMQYYNSDGNLSSLCGNGSRCAVAYAHKKGMILNEASFTSNEITNKCTIQDMDVEIEMNAISKINKNDRGHFVLNTGSPHYIIFDSIQDDKLIEKARAIRYSDEFPEGINVNWVTKIGEKELFVRTYERGVEDETYSCGTGVTAAALAYAHEYKIEHDVINIKTKGGDFLIRFGAENDHFKNVKLKGAATFVFEGEITI